LLSKTQIKKNPLLIAHQIVPYLIEKKKNINKERNDSAYQFKGRRKNEP